MSADFYFYDADDKPKPASELFNYLVQTRVLAAINYLKEQLEDPTLDTAVTMTLRVLEARLVVKFFKEAGLEVEEALKGLDEREFAEIIVHPPHGLMGYNYVPDEPEPAPEAKTETEG